MEVRWLLIPEPNAVCLSGFQDEQPVIKGAIKSFCHEHGGPSISSEANGISGTLCNQDLITKVNFHEMKWVGFSDIKTEFREIIVGISAAFRCKLNYVREI